MDNSQFLLQQVLQRYGLADANAHSLRSYNNQIYCLERADHQRFSLRICGFPNMKRRSMEDEMIWLDFVAQHNPRLAPRPIANDQGELVTAISTPQGERLICLFAWVEGTELHGEATLDLIHKFGQSVAALHNIAQKFPFPDANSGFRSDYRYDQSLVLSHRGWIDKYRSAIGVENVALLNHAIDYVLAAMEDIGTTPAHYGVIHADLSFGNILVQEGEIYLIDFEQLGRGHFLYDFAVLWYALREESADFALRWQSFVAGYAQVRELPFRQEAELQPFIVATQLNFLDWFYNSMTPAVQAKFEPRLSAVYAEIRHWIAIG